MPTPAPLTAEQFAALRRLDSPTVANAIEAFGIRPWTTGFVGSGIRCLMPEAGVLLGYAVTATLDSQTEHAPQDRTRWLDVLRAVAATPHPAVLVFQDIGPRRTHSCHFGDVMANSARAAGAIGLVTDAGVRDLAGCRELGFQYFAPGTVVSHGRHRVVDVQVPVAPDGMVVRPGDLIHGDENGVVVIPIEIAARVAEAAAEVAAKEARLIAYSRSAEFTVEGYARLYTGK